MSVCTYKNENAKYSCELLAEDGGPYCLFHNEKCLEGDNYEKNKDKVANQFKSLLEKHQNDKALKFIGYCLPEYSFTETLFNQPIYFNDAIFYGSVSFRGVTFSRKAHFFGTEFQKEANFEGAKFLDKAFFNGATFQKACFKEVQFSNDVYFSYVDTKVRDEHKLGTMFHGIASFEEAKFSKAANFHTATFCKDVTFFRATFSNITYFFRIKFCKLANFNECTFLNKTDFRTTYFFKALFRYVRFASEVYFMDVIFKERTLFNYTIFEHPNSTVFGLRDKDLNYREPIDCGPDKSPQEWLNTDMSVGEFQLSELNMSKVSFVNCDVSRVRFSELIKWGGDGFRIHDEEWFIEAKGLEKQGNIGQEDYKENVNPKEDCVVTYKKYDSPNLEGVISVYRSLRENYEFRLRYDDAGKFFIKEMELKRLYRIAAPTSKYRLKLINFAKKLTRDKTPIQRVEYHKNGWPRRHFSLTGLYYHLSRYGESILRPILVGTIIIALSTLIFLLQDAPPPEPFITNFYSTFDKQVIATAALNFNGINHTWYNVINHVWNNTLTSKAFERSLADFVPLLSLNNDINTGIIDFVIKIVGGGLTFVLLGVALRRKFERKYTR